MNVLRLAAIEAKRLGMRAGESATAWQARDPEAARQYAAWMAAHRPALVAALSAQVTHA